MEKSKRKEMEFQFRRNEILKQAEKIFASKGFYDTTMMEIASASGFAVGTLYQFFSGKEDLYTAMVSEKLDMMYSEIKGEVSKTKKVTDKIERLVKSHFRFVENNVDFCNLFIRGEGASPPKGKPALREKLIAEYFNYISFIEDIMRRGIETGILRNMEPRVMAFSLLGIIRLTIYDWLLTQSGNSLCEKVDHVLNIFMRGVGSEVSR